MWSRSVVYLGSVSMEVKPELRDLQPTFSVDPGGYLASL